jgi:hypothetical protein
MARAFILRRLREPSTWAGLALVMGVALPHDVAAQLGALAAGLVAVLLPEGRAS